MRKLRQTEMSQVPGSSESCGVKAAAESNRRSNARVINRLKDAVYREMLLLEVNRPGAEMGLALALLRAVVQSGSLNDREEFQRWVRVVCPVGLQLIEASLQGAKCESGACRERT